MGIFRELFNKAKIVEESLSDEIQTLIKLENLSNKKIALINEFIAQWDKGKLKKIEEIYSLAGDILNEQFHLIESFSKRIYNEDKALVDIIKSNTDDYKKSMNSLKIAVNFLKSDLQNQFKFFENGTDSLWLRRKRIKELVDEISKEAEHLHNVEIDVKVIRENGNYLLGINKKQIMNILKRHNSLSKKVIAAIDQAERSHKGQLRDTGSDYINEHVYPVVYEIIMFCKQTGEKLTEELICGALLHDTLEDDPSLTKEIFLNRFGEKILSIVQFITKPDYRDYPGKNEEQKRLSMDKDYFNAIYMAPRETQIIKVADRINNLSFVILSRKDKIERYVRESKRFHLPLAKQVSPYFYKRMKDLLDCFEKL